MRLLVQRVREARVETGAGVAGAIGPGLVVLVGITHADTPAEASFLAGKTARLRVFDDDQGVMNRSLLDTGGACLAVSQFTLYADTRKGNRPSYIDSAPAEQARPLFEAYVAALRELGVPVATGVFQAEMQVFLVNDGPVTVALEREAHGR